MVVVNTGGIFQSQHYCIQNSSLLLRPKAILLKKPQLLATGFPRHVVRSCGLVNRIGRITLPREKAFGLTVVGDSQNYLEWTSGSGHHGPSLQDHTAECLLLSFFPRIQQYGKKANLETDLVSQTTAVYRFGFQDFAAGEGLLPKLLPHGKASIFCLLF